MRRISFLVAGFHCLAGIAGAQLPTGGAVPAWTLVEDLRIGADDGPRSFNDVRSIVATKNGNIFVLDFKTQQIRVFDAKGEFLKLAAREGAGPGEIRNANGLAVGANDIVWVNDPSNGRFSLYRPDGSFHKQVLVRNSGFGYVWAGVIDEQGRAIENVFVQKGGRTEVAYRIVTEGGTADTVQAPTCKGNVAPPEPGYLAFRRADGRGGRNMQLPFVATTFLKLTPSGNAWCTPASEYRLWVGKPGSANKEVVSLKVTPLPVSSDERKQHIERVDSIVKHYGPLTAGDPSLIPAVKPVIGDIQVDDRSRVWVRMTSSPENAPAFDVFDTAGRLVARVNGKGRVSSYITSITNSHVYTTLLDADDVPVIVRYRIVR